MFFLRQVDDFAISSSNTETINQLLQDIDNNHLKTPLKKLGILKNFNGIDVLQSKHFVKISCTRYINKLLQAHKWINENTRKVTSPMTYNHKMLSEMATTVGPVDVTKASKLELQNSFRYRQAIGELMFAAITCRPDILFPTIYLSQSSNHPAQCHYSAVKRIFRYLRSTPDHGIHYWRKTPSPSLPNHPDPILTKDNHHTKIPSSTFEKPQAYSDADWGSNPATPRSVSGIAVYLAGGPVMYRCKFQQCVALSSTESELYAASEAGKAILYIRSVLNHLGMSNTSPTPLYVDNNATICISNTTKPTKRLRHVNLREFAIIEWVQRGDMSLKSISTSDNPTDSLTKSLRPQLHHRHSESLLGMRKPSYTNSS